MFQFFKTVPSSCLPTVIRSSYFLYDIFSSGLASPCGMILSGCRSMRNVATHSAVCTSSAFTCAFQNLLKTYKNAVTPCYQILFGDISVGNEVRQATLFSFLSSFFDAMKNKASNVMFVNNNDGNDDASSGGKGGRGGGSKGKGSGSGNGNGSRTGRGAGTGTGLRAGTGLGPERGRNAGMGAGIWGKNGVQLTGGQLKQKAPTYGTTTSSKSIFASLFGQPQSGNDIKSTSIKIQENKNMRKKGVAAVGLLCALFLIPSGRLNILGNGDGNENQNSQKILTQSSLSSNSKKLITTHNVINKAKKNSNTVSTKTAFQNLLNNFIANRKSPENIPAGCPLRRAGFF